MQECQSNIMLFYFLINFIPVTDGRADILNVVAANKLCKVLLLYFLVEHLCKCTQKVQNSSFL